MRLKKIIMPLAAALGLAASAAESVDWRVVAAEQATKSLVMLSGEPGASAVIDWRWDPRLDPNVGPGRADAFSEIDECKVKDDGRTVLVNASNGGVAAIDVATRRAKWFCRVPEHCAGPHSVDLLPDGCAAVANSTGVDALQIIDFAAHPFEPEKQTVRNVLPLAGAHGVWWDAARRSIFALGYTNLFELAYEPADKSVRVLNRWDYSGVTGEWHGHDLVQDGFGGYYLTHHDGVWHFDPKTETFASVMKRANVKGYSRDAVKGDLFTTPRERWWTDRITVVGTNGVERTVGPFPGAKFYKARWYAARPPKLR